MATSLSFGAYTCREVAHAVPIRIIGPDSRQHRQLSRAVSAVKLDPGLHASRACPARFVEFLNEAERTLAGAADAFVESVSGCRRVIERWLATQGVHSQSAAAKDGSLWLMPPEGIYHRVEDTLTTISAVTAVLSDEVFGGQDPSKVDRRLSRTDGKPSVTRRNRRGALRTDTDRIYRLGRDPTSAPRSADPRVHERWLEGLRRIGAPEAVVVAHELARWAGPRAGMVLALTLADVFLSPEGEIASPKKGSGGVRSVRLLPRRSTYERLLEYVAGPRAAAGGPSLDRIRALAADPRRRGQLAAMPLLTENGRDPMKYDRLYRVSRRAAVLMDLFIRDDAFLRTGVKRYVGFHFNRHEYVHDRLDRVATLPKSAQAAARADLIEYMGWSGEDMLRWYSAHHARRQSARSARDYNEHVDGEMDGAIWTAPDGLDGRSAVLGALSAAI